MEHTTHNHETPFFWIVTVIAILVVAIAIGIFSWFVYIGHEPYEPVHDENPHAQIMVDSRSCNA